MEIKYIDRYTFNNKLGEQFAYCTYTDQIEQILALKILQSRYLNPKTIYTNWFYFIDPYPNQELYIQPCIKL